MKCPEVVEWMHRYIDRDLNEEESSVMFEHIRTCSDCAEEFEMLNMLSARLEELPKVTPSFSLVDSILPKLDAIDRARQEEGSTLEIIPDMIPAATNEDTINRNSNRPKTSRRRRAYVGGALGLAAALILGVFIYQYEPLTISDAEIASSSLNKMNSNDTASPAADSAAQGTDSDSKFSTSDSGTNVDTGTGTGSKEDTTELQESSNKETNDQGYDYSGGDVISDPANTEDGTKKIYVPQATPPAEDSGDKSAKKYASAEDANADSNARNQQSSGSSSSDKLKNDTAVSNEKRSDTGSAADQAESSAIPSEALPVLPVQEMPVADTNEHWLIGIAQFAGLHNLNEWTSPDGNYIVVKQKEYVSLYQIDPSEKRVLLSEIPLKGEWVAGGWSEDGKIFTYEIIQDGIASISTITPE
ncbi:hypothetical protein D3C76_42110 [compost metagenome]